MRFTHRSCPTLASADGTSGLCHVRRRQDGGRASVRSAYSGVKRLLWQSKTPAHLFLQVTGRIRPLASGVGASRHLAVKLPESFFTGQSAPQ
jgi:hypothetical protein